MDASNHCDDKDCHNIDINIFEMTYMNGVTYCSECFHQLQLNCGYGNNSSQSILGQQIIQRNNNMIRDDAVPLHVTEDGIDFYQCQSNFEINGIDCEHHHLYLETNKLVTLIPP